MTLQYLTVISNKRQFDRVYYYVDIDLAKCYIAKPKDFYSQFSIHFPENIRREILEALDKQWDFVIDIQGQELIRIQNTSDITDIKPVISAREAERELRENSHNENSVFGKIQSFFGTKDFS
jgi:hypothetical protein